MLQELLDVFRPTTPERIRDKQLAEARRDLLLAEAHAEYYDGMAAICRARIERLTATNPSTN